jgi:hypothetical protein
MKRDRDESSYRHYMRVRMGATGPKGRLLKCKKRDGSGYFWKVKLDSGEWVWPDGLVLDGPGDRVATCGDCGIAFMADGRSPLCPTCDESAFGEPSEIRNIGAALSGNRSGVKAPAPIDQEAAAEQRRRDHEDLEKNSPY